jgi:hypothetical protein
VSTTENTPNETNDETAAQPIEVYAADRRAAWAKDHSPEALEQARRLHQLDGKTFRNPEVRVNDADQRAYDELVKKDDAEQAKKAAAQKALEKSWEDLEKRTTDDQQQQGDGAGLLQVPMEVGRDHYLQVEQYVQALSPLVSGAGFDQETAQEVINHAVSLAVMDQSGVSLEDPAACVTVLQRQLGGDEAASIIRDAQDAADKFGQEFKDWLDETQLGNSPAVLQALAAYTRGEFSMSATAAQSELEKLTRDPKSAYRNAGDPKHKSAVARANLLYARVTKAEERAAKQPKGEPMQPGRANEMAAMDAEIKALNRHPAMRDHGNPEHATIKARVEKLYSLRYPE